MGVLAKFPATPGQFVKDNTTDLVNLILGWAVFWCYGFRLVYTCGYTTTRTVSRYYCEQFYQALSEATGSTCSISLADGLPTWSTECETQFQNTPAFSEIYTEVRGASLHQPLGCTLYVDARLSLVKQFPFRHFSTLLVRCRTCALCRRLVPPRRIFTGRALAARARKSTACTAPSPHLAPPAGLCPNSTWLVAVVARSLLLAALSAGIAFLLLCHVFLPCSLTPGLCGFCCCSGTNGSGEFIVTLLLMALVTVVFFWKMAKFVHCPDKLERKRRKEVMLKDFLLSQNSTSD